MVTELILNSMVLVNIKHIDIHQLLKSIYVLNMSLDALPSVQQSSVSVELSRVQLYDPTDCSTPGLHVCNQLQEFIQTHVQ